MTNTKSIREFVLESFYVSDPGELTDDLSLIDSGIVDSTGMMDLIVHLESAYGIEIEDYETVPDNLETLARIAAFVTRKQQELLSEERLTSAASTA